MSNYNKDFGVKTKQNRCSKCNSTMTHYRLKTKERVCRGCGHIEVEE